MAMLSKLFVQQMYDRFRFLGNWLPFRPLELGDVGFFTKKGGFVRATTLSELGVTFDVRTAPDGGNIEYQSQSDVSITLKASGEPAVAGSALSLGEAGITVQFGRKDALVLHLFNTSQMSIENPVGLREAILPLYKERTWNRKWVVVTEKVKAESTTLLVSGSRNSQVDLKAAADVPHIQLADAALDLGFKSHRNMAFKYLSEVGGVPLFKAWRVRDPLFASPIFEPRLRSLFAEDLEEAEEQSPVFEEATPDSPDFADDDEEVRPLALPVSRSLQEESRIREEGDDRLRSLLVHGIGNQEERLDLWVPEWKGAIGNGISRVKASRAPLNDDFHVLLYDRFFEDRPPDPATLAEAIFKLGGGWISSSLGLGRRSLAGDRGFDPFGWARDKWEDVMHWRVGMTAHWTTDEGLRRELREHVRSVFREQRPDLVFAHSLGSLVMYDTIREMHTNPHLRDEYSEYLSGVTLITFGSQLGHPAIREGVFAGRIAPLDLLKNWFFLHNPHDEVFAYEPPNIIHSTFQRVNTAFGGIFSSDHEATGNGENPGYLDHPNTHTQLWPRVADDAATLTRARSFIQYAEKIHRGDSQRHRALLIGINRYAYLNADLEGCENDVYLISELLQEAGFPSSGLRMVLDDRATREGILSRLAWLLEDARPGDYRFLHFSGHGIRIPVYGPTEEVDRMDECFVTHDFSFHGVPGIRDKDFFSLYADLDYGVRFVGIIDACHSGGLARSNGLRVRGLNLPEDIRHRMLAYESGEWITRKLRVLHAGRDQTTRAAFTGESGSIERIGRAVSSRPRETSRFDAAKTLYGHQGPYHPTLYQACAEYETAAEARVGNLAYGAFTHTLVSQLRAIREKGLNPTFQELLDSLQPRLIEEHRQTPQLYAPSAVKSSGKVFPH